MSETIPGAAGKRIPTRAFRIEQMGVCMARVLREGTRGEVAAVFERSFYVTVGGQWVCLVPKGGGLGPLNVECREASLAGAIQGLRIGEAAAVQGRSLRIGHALDFSFAEAAIWNPSLPAGWNRESVARGLALLNETVMSRDLPQEGLAALLADPVPAPRNAVATAAQAPLRSMQEFMRMALARSGGAPDAAALLPLIGLGPGLTPSGDDAIGGALIALHLLGEDNVRDLLWQAVVSHARTATGDISFAHLSAAAEGFGHEAIHHLVNRVMQGGADLPGALDAVHAIGHTSGWDALAGVAAAFNAWLEARGTRARGDAAGRARA